MENSDRVESEHEPVYTVSTFHISIYKLVAMNPVQLVSSPVRKLHFSLYYFPAHLPRPHPKKKKTEEKQTESLTESNQALFLMGFASFTCLSCLPSWVGVKAEAEANKRKVRAVIVESLRKRQWLTWWWW